MSSVHLLLERAIERRDIRSLWQSRYLTVT